jgi:hypothetical protein
MQGNDFNDLDEVPEAVATTTESAARNAVHLAGVLREHIYPAYTQLSLFHGCSGFRPFPSSPEPSILGGISLKELLWETHTSIRPTIAVPIASTPASR